MSYPGGFPPGAGYGHGYSPPDSYQYNEAHQHLSNLRTQPTWDASFQGRSTQQSQQVDSVYQVRPQLHEQIVYYPQQQQNQLYQPHHAVAGSSLYGLSTPRAQSHYPQYVSHHKHSHNDYEPPVLPSFHNSNQPRAQIASPNFVARPQQLLNPTPNTNIQVSENYDQIRLLSKIQPTSDAKSNSIDISMLMISLAEEYIAIAYRMVASASQIMSKEQTDQYQSLIAIALGCLEASFKKSRLVPRLEARVRLRYANVLVEETENYAEAETALSHGIILCEQNRYLDLKYSMKFLLARIIFMKNPKAALKALERLCADTEAYRHRPWEYVFRLLRASFSSRSARTSDTQAALHDLRYVSSLATGCGDRAVFLLSSLMEVLIHLSSSNHESSEQAQTALAAVWTYQLDIESQIPQLLVLTHILDVACSLMYNLPAQSESKQKAMEEAYKKTSWSTSTDINDEIALPIKTTENLGKLVSHDSREVLGVSDDGKHILMISLLNNNDAFALIYLLSGIALMHNNCIDGKSAQYLQQALQSLQDSNKSWKYEGPLATMTKKLQWRQVLSCYILIYLVFCSASSYDWEPARDYLGLLGDTLKEVNHESVCRLANFHVYLSGICYQGTGDLENALQMYSDPRLGLSDGSGLNSGPDEQARHELSLLAVLNTLWIQQADPKNSAAQSAAMIAKLEPLCTNHPNKDLDTAFKLVKATVPTDPPISGVKIKSYLGATLDATKVTCNKQFLCITLSVMCSSFFVGVVGLQANKAARAAVLQAKKTRNTLWMSVTNSLLAQNLGLQGKHEESQEVQKEAIRLAALSFPRFS